MKQLTYEDFSKLAMVGAVCATDPEFTQKVQEKFKPFQSQLENHMDEVWNMTEEEGEKFKELNYKVMLDFVDSVLEG